MSRSRILRTAVVAASAVGVAALGLAVPAQAADPGVYSKRIVIGMTTPQTGPASAGYLYIPKAAEAYFNYVNLNGGINGREIDLMVRDDMYSPAKTQQVTNELILNDKIFAMYGALGTDTHNTVVDTLNKKGIPDVFVNTGASQFGNVKKYPMTFPFFPSYSVEAKVMAKYIQDTASLANLKRCFM